jgi:prepilin-type N-terminal cleavage/methylation domain-containing protein
MKRLVRDARGFTLAELLIVCAILGFMMGALFTLQRQGQLAYLTGAARVEVQQNARLALDMMITDIRSALPAAGTTQVVTAIDNNCSTGAPPATGGGTSISFTDQNGTAVAYGVVAAGVNGCTTADAPCLQKNNVTVVGGVQQLQIWCYNGSGTLNNTLANIREIRIQIRTKTERGAGTGTAGDQHAVAESRVRFRNI